MPSTRATASDASLTAASWFALRDANNECAVSRRTSHAVSRGAGGVDLRDGLGYVLGPALCDDHVREIYQRGGLDPPVAASSAGAQRVLDGLLGTTVVTCSQPHPGVEECHRGASHVQVEVRKSLAGLLHQRARLVLFPCHRLKYRLEPEQSKPATRSPRASAVS